MKIFKLFFVTLTLLLSSSVHGQPKTRIGVEALLNNYKISYTIDDEGLNFYCIFQARCEQGWAYRIESEWDNQFLVVDEEAGKVYFLNYQEKTGKLYTFASRFAYRGFELPHLFIHESTDIIYDSRFKPTGERQTIAGRPTTIYSYEYSNGSGTFWIDDKYGFSMKYVQKGYNDMLVEVTEFIDGGITMADMVDLSEYTITEAD